MVFEVYFSVLSVVTAQVACPLSGVLRWGIHKIPEAEADAAAAEPRGSEDAQLLGRMNCLVTEMGPMWGNLTVVLPSEMSQGLQEDM